MMPVLRNLLYGDKSLTSLDLLGDGGEGGLCFCCQINCFIYLPFVSSTGAVRASHEDEGRVDRHVCM